MLPINHDDGAAWHVHLVDSLADASAAPIGQRGRGKNYNLFYEAGAGVKDTRDYSPRPRCTPELSIVTSLTLNHQGFHRRETFYHYRCGGRFNLVG